MNNPWEMSTSHCQSIESVYRCPINDCSIHINDKPIKWTHKNCGGYFRLYENGKEKCQKCGEEDFFAIGIIAVIVIIKINNSIILQLGQFYNF